MSVVKKSTLFTLLAFLVFNATAEDYRHWGGGIRNQDLCRMALSIYNNEDIWEINSISTNELRSSRGGYWCEVNIKRNKVYLTEEGEHERSDGVIFFDIQESGIYFTKTKNETTTTLVFEKPTVVVVDEVYDRVSFYGEKRKQISVEREDRRRKERIAQYVNQVSPGGENKTKGNKFFIKKGSLFCTSKRTFEEQVSSLVSGGREYVDGCFSALDRIEIENLRGEGFSAYSGIGKESKMRYWFASENLEF